MIKLLKENIGGKLHDTGYGNDFLSMTPKPQAKQSKHRQIGLHQTQKLLHSKENNQSSEKEWNKK